MKIPVIVMMFYLVSTVLRGAVRRREHAQVLPPRSAEHRAQASIKDKNKTGYCRFLHLQFVLFRGGIL